MSIETVATWRSLVSNCRTLGWAAFVATGAILWGYDSQIGGILLASYQFRHDFGYVLDDEPVISAMWQAAFSSAAAFGGISGSIMCGSIADRLGRRAALAIGCLVSIIAVSIEYFATSSVALVIGKLVNGCALGAFLTTSSVYCAETSPVELRGITTSAIHFCIAIGNLLASVALKVFGNFPTRAAYRIPFAIQWLFPIILLSGLPFCPESPWWLLRQGRFPQAMSSLQSLGISNPEVELNYIQEMIKNEASQAHLNFLDCFRGVDLRRTEIATGVFVVQQLLGPVFMIGYAPYFFELAGLVSEASFSLTVALSLSGIFGNVVSWFLVNTAGRRLTFFLGTCILTICLFVVGMMEVIPCDGMVPVHIQSLACGVYDFIYFLTVGPMTYTILSEVSSPILRSRTVGLGFVVQNVFYLTLSILIPFLINPDEANMKGRVAFIFAAASVPSILWVYVRVPETKSRTFKELTQLFEEGVPARDFATQGVNVPEFEALIESSEE
ncbi:general substrate transporter [Paraphoma chrysanthemicola]|nr:general substrate transporter [Paraphoma chrysanthemicola]